MATINTRFDRGLRQVIKALIRATDPVEAPLTELGYVMEQYLTIQYDPAISIAILGRIVHLGNEYEVRAYLPTSAAENPATPLR